MVGRAGRTGMTTVAAAEHAADAYILLRPEEVGRFSTLVRRHVEDVQSQLLTAPDRYRTGNTTPSSTERPTRLNGVTRILLGFLLEDQCGGRRLSSAMEVYKLTLLYQRGDTQQQQAPGDDGGGRSVVTWTLRPLLDQLRVSP